LIKWRRGTSSTGIERPTCHPHCCAQLLGLTPSPKGHADSPVEHPPHCQLNHASVVAALRQLIELSDALRYWANLGSWNFGSMRRRSSPWKTLFGCMRKRRTNPSVDDYRSHWTGIHGPAGTKLSTQHSGETRVKIGFIGLGRMGSAMAKNLVMFGHAMGAARAACVIRTEL
jgi:NAD binding domain of 6-phosphogluconate dehydrogenase